MLINYQNRKTLNPIGPERAGFTAEDNTLVQDNTLPPLDEVISKLNMTDSTAEYLPLEKTWYHYTDEGATLPETEPATTEVPETDTAEAPTEPTSLADSGTAGSDTDPAQSGCASAAGSALALTAIAGAAVLCNKRKKRK